MADRSGDERPVIEYAPPARADVRNLVIGNVLGLASAAVLVVGSAVAGAYIDATVNRGVQYAGLGGLIVGGLVGLGLVLASGLLALLAGRRRSNPRLRGIGQGLLVSLGLAGLWFGVCAVM